MTISTTETNTSTRIAEINERMTGPPALALLARSGILDTTRGIRLLDNASGIGTLIFQLIGQLPGHPNLQFNVLAAADIDSSYLSHVRHRASNLPRPQPIETFEVDQQSPIILPDASFTHVTNNFGIFFARDQDAVLHQTLRLLQPDGIAGFTSWNKFSWWDEIFLPAMKESLPDAPALPHPMALFNPVWSEPQSSKRNLEEAGFVNVEAEVFEFTPDVDPEDLVKACSVLISAVTAKTWNTDIRERFESRIEGAFEGYLKRNWQGGVWNGKMKAVITFGRKMA